MRPPQPHSDEGGTGGDSIAVRGDVTVCGLGYVGLALAREASRAGLTVVGYDLDERTVAALRAGHSHVDDVSDRDLEAMLAAGFTVTADPSALGWSPVVVVCVPTPLDQHDQPDLGAVYGAVTGVANRLRPGTLVVLESTSYPGTTEEVVLPVLERASGLVAGEDFHLAYSPERIDPGNRSYDFARTPKVVGGYRPACADRAVRFYERFTDRVVRARGIREAEMAKLLENVYRHVNIALANEMAILCDELGIDVWDAIGCAATKPFGFQPFEPGPGVGGHCIPVDPLYLLYRARQAGTTSRMIDTADAINRDMPRYLVRRCGRLLERRGRALVGSRVLLLGVTYKADVADLRMSPAYEVARGFRAAGARLAYHDPYVPDWQVDGSHVPRSEDLASALAQADLVVLLQKHRGYDPAELGQAELIFDARGLLADSGLPQVESM